MAFESWVMYLLQADIPLVPQFFRLIVTLMAFSFSFLVSYALLAHQAKAWLQSAGRKTLLNRASGSVFIGFGVLLATSSNNWIRREPRYIRGEGKQ